VKKALAYLYEDDDDSRFNFGARSDIDPTTLQPTPVDIIRIWQIYLDNVNPLLKCTHTPTLQTRIIAATADLSSATPELQALMFGIYCVSMLTLSDAECMTLFGSKCGDMLRKFQLGCRQALLRCGILRTDDRDCLTAFYLYLVSSRKTPSFIQDIHKASCPGSSRCCTFTSHCMVSSASHSDFTQLSTKPRAEPRSLSTNLGIAIRLGQQYVVFLYWSSYLRKLTYRST
jgi:hypothetical protein